MCAHTNTRDAASGVGAQRTAHRLHPSPRMKALAAPYVFNFLASAYKTIQHDKDIFGITFHIRFERGSFHLKW
jgi:hypothetical protein